MANFKFTKSTDASHEIALESRLLSATWAHSCVYAGKKARGIVALAMVGEGAKIEIVVKNQKGKKITKITDVVHNNGFVGLVEIPKDAKLDDRVYFEVKLPDNGLQGKSNIIPVLLEPRLKNMRWSTAEARRGDTVTLSAEFENVRDNTEATLIICEYDTDGAHDPTVELSSLVKGGKISFDWEYQYFEDTDEIPTQEEKERYGENYNSPEYFFKARVGDLEFGLEQESGLLVFKDWIEIHVNDPMHDTTAPKNYILHLPDGTTKTGELDEKGVIREDALPPGKMRIEFPDPEDPPA